MMHLAIPPCPLLLVAEPNWLSIAPPLVAIVLAMLFRRVLWALLAGVFAGTLILAEGNLTLAVANALEVHLWGALTNADHLRVFAFTLLMGGMVGVMNRSAGMQGLVNLLAPLARGRRGGQLTTWALGLVIFFDDYANSVLLGNTLRPIADRLRISREKLAYVVDSTAAPVAGLALVSTWIATEVSYIGDGLTQAGIPGDPYAMFVATIPYRFYVLLALVFVALVAITGRDFGPMLSAERRVTRASAPQAVDLFAPDGVVMPETHLPARWYNAVLPVLVTLGVVLWLMCLTGERQLHELDPVPPATLANLIANSDSYLALLYGALAGLMTAVVLARTQRLLNPQQVRAAFATGAYAMLPALAVLTLAWALSSVTDEHHLNAGAYLGRLVSGRLAPEWLPTIVFLAAGITAFATGTSWGTMGLLTPLAITTTAAVLTADDASMLTADHPLLLATVGSVLAGAIFGDHCSPLSDTTILSAQASGCPHLAHVVTQMPYAVLVAGVAILLGTLPAGYGLPAWLLLPLGIAALWATLRFVGRLPEEPLGNA